MEFDGQDLILSQVWIPRLRIILDHFVESAQTGSSRNLDFWHHIVSHTGHGCAGPDYLTGWITTFSIFNQDGEMYANVEPGSWPVVGIKEIHHNVASCRATIDDNGHSYNATLFVGQMAYDYELDTNRTSTNLPTAVQIPENDKKRMKILKPRNDWALVVEEGFVQVPPKTGKNAKDATFVDRGLCPGEQMWVIEAAPIQQLPNSVEKTSTAPALGEEDASTNDWACGTTQLSWVIPTVVVIVLFLVLVAACMLRKKKANLKSSTCSDSVNTLPNTKEHADVP